MAESKAHTEQDMVILTGDNSDNYAWNTTDKSLINKIMNAKNGELLECDPFVMCNLQWAIQIYPNVAENADSNHSSKRRGGLVGLN